MMLKGITASEGYAIAKVLKLDQQVIDTTKKKIHNITDEISDFHDAIQETVSQLIELKTLSQSKLNGETANIFDAHIAIAEDPELIKLVEAKIKKESCNLTYAITSVIMSFVEQFQAIDDEYLKQRASDLLEVSDHLIKNHLNIQMINLETIKAPVILVAHEITAATAALINPLYIKGLVSEIGGKNAHASIIARLLDIPALVGVQGLLSELKNDQMVILDATSGKLIKSFNENTRKMYQEKITAHQLKIHKLEALIGVKSETIDHHHVPLLANIASTADLDYALSQNASGIGLYRTEFLFMDRYELPTLDEQFLAYKKVLKAMAPLPVTIRTLDIGGDKPLPYLKQSEEQNPALGLRGIRFSLKEQKVFETQIKALLKASPYGNLKMMFPMISTREEFIKLKTIVETVEKELIEANEKVGEYQLGIMVEVPSAALNAEHLAKVVDFFSIGTNDLIQYTFAADRLNADLAYLDQALHPAILKLIKMVTDASSKHGIETSVCGEMASDPKAAMCLVGLGVDNLSMSASQMVKVKDQLLRCQYQDLKVLAQICLDSSNEKDVLRKMNQHIK